jgi:hypothetical protein
MLETIRNLITGDPITLLGRIVIAAFFVMLVRAIAGFIYNKALHREYRYDGALEGFVTTEISTPTSRIAEGLHFAGDALLLVLLALGCGTLLLNITVIMVALQNINKPDHLNDILRGVARDLITGFMLLALVIALLGLLRALFQALRATAQAIGKPKDPVKPPTPPQRAKRY